MGIDTFYLGIWTLALGPEQGSYLHQGIGVKMAVSINWESVLQVSLQLIRALLFGVHSRALNFRKRPDRCQDLLRISRARACALRNSAPQASKDGELLRALNPKP